MSSDSVPARSGLLAEVATTFVIACVLIGGWIALISALPHGLMRDTFDGAYQHMTVFLLFWHLLILAFRAWRVYRPEVQAMRQEWFNGSGPVTSEAVAEVAARAAGYEAEHGHSLITRRLVLVEGHLATHGSAAELSSLLERRAEADRGRAEDAYALPRFLFWAIPILGFIGTVVGIGGAIAGLKTGDITSADVLREQIGHVAGSLGTAFYATQVALILSVIALLAQTMLYQSEMKLHDDIDDLLTYQLETRLAGESTDQSALVAAIQRHTAAIADDAARRDQAARTHVQALIGGHEQLAKSLDQITAAATGASTSTAAAAAAAQQAHRQIADQAQTIADAVGKSLALHAGATKQELERTAAALGKALADERERSAASLLKALTDERERWNAAVAAREAQLGGALAQRLAEATTPLGAAVGKAVAQIETAVAALQQQRSAEVGRNTQQAAALESTLSGVQEALRQLPPAIQQLRKPIQVQLSLAPGAVSGGNG